MNNGNCNKINDNAICDFDGGDCTLEEWNDDIWNFFEIFDDYDGYEDYLEFCPDIKIGDKFCDDELNIPSCNYDGGDCCDETISMIPFEPTNQPGKPLSQMNQLHPNQDGKPPKPNQYGKPPKPNQPGKPNKSNLPGKSHPNLLDQTGKPHKSNQPGKSEPNQPDELYLNQTEKPSDNTYQLSGKSEPNQQFQKPLLNELTKPLKHLMWDAFCIECQCKA